MTERTATNEQGGTDMAEQYVGPSAIRIANLLPHRVSFERGWFWTTTAVCHGGKSDGLAFRQRPDGNGIEVKCHTGGCSAGVVITELEVLIGLSIWTAYAQVHDTPVKAPEKQPWWKRKKVMVAGAVVLVVAAPLHDARRGALLPEPRRAGHRGAAASAVHAPASGRQAASTLTTGVSGSLIPIPNTQGPSPSGGGPSSLPASGRNRQGNKARALRRCTMTTATLATGTRSMDTVDRPRRSLEELVDQLFAAMGFKDPETETAETAETGAVRSIHEARRLRQAGDVDGALAVLAGVDAAQAETREVRWAFSEWTQLVKRRFGGRGALVYSQGTGRAAALVPTGDGGTLEVAAVLGMRWRPGKVVSGRSLRGLRPLTGGA